MKISMDEREFATILAALRYWQREGLMSAGAEQDIATDGGTLEPLNVEQIDSLCGRMNNSVIRDDWTVEVIRLAEEQHAEEGTCEIDPDALVSEGADNGAYVEAWVWVDFAGTDLDREAEEEV